MVQPTLQLVILDTLWTAQLQWIAMMGPFQLLQLAQVIYSTTIRSKIKSHSCLDCFQNRQNTLTCYILRKVFETGTLAEQGPKATFQVPDLQQKCQGKVSNLKCLLMVA